MLNIEERLKKMAGDFDHNQYNPPFELRVAPIHVPEEWVFVGLVPAPKSRIGWFIYHFVHGMVMGYPFKSVLAFSLLNTNVKKKM